MQMGRANSVAVLVTSRGFSDFPHPSATYRRLLSSPNPGVSCCLDSLERSGMMRGFRLRAQAKPAKLVLEAGSHPLRMHDLNVSAPHLSHPAISFLTYFCMETRVETM